jgi:hypothetical protein
MALEDRHVKAVFCEEYREIVTAFAELEYEIRDRFRKDEMRHDLIACVRIKRDIVLDANGFPPLELPITTRAIREAVSREVERQQQGAAHV